MPEPSSSFALPIFQDTFLTEKQAAELIGLSAAWLQRKRAEGGGPAFVKLGNSVRYKHSKLMAFMDAREQTSTSNYKTHQKPPRKFLAEF